MGCCGFSMTVLIICSIQLFCTFERLVLDFMSYLYLSIILNIAQLNIAIIAVFGLCLYKWKFILAYVVWQSLYIVWNIFCICVYTQAGSFNENSAKIMSFGHTKSWWILHEQELNCRPDSCPISGEHIEVLHASLHILLSIFGLSSATFVVFKLREKDKIDPRGYVSTNTSHRSSLARNGTLPQVAGSDHWIASNNTRGSLRSNRSSRSARQAGKVPADTPPHRQSKKRSSTRSNKSNRTRVDAAETQDNPRRSTRGSQRKRPNNLPFVSIVSSSVNGSDVPHSPVTPGSPPVRETPLRGHDNEIFGYSSSNETPYNEYRHHGNGPPPGGHNARHRGVSAIADLPPPLEEGPEAYSRNHLDEAGLPPPPAVDGPEPYSERSRNRTHSTSSQGRRRRDTSSGRQSPGPNPRLSVAPIDRAARVNYQRGSHHKEPESPSSSSSDESASKGAASPSVTPQSTPVKTLYAAPKRPADLLPAGLLTPGYNSSDQSVPVSPSPHHTEFRDNVSRPGAFNHEPYSDRQPGTRGPALVPPSQSSDRNSRSDFDEVPMTQVSTKPHQEPITPNRKTNIKDNTFMRMVTGNQSNRAAARSIPPPQPDDIPSTPYRLPTSSTTNRQDNASAQAAAQHRLHNAGANQRHPATSQSYNKTAYHQLPPAPAVNYNQAQPPPPLVDNHHSPAHSASIQQSQNPDPPVSNQRHPATSPTYNKTANHQLPPAPAFNYNQAQPPPPLIDNHHSPAHSASIQQTQNPSPPVSNQRHPPSPTANYNHPPPSLASNRHPPHAPPVSYSQAQPPAPAQRQPHQPPQRASPSTVNTDLFPPPPALRSNLNNPSSPYSSKADIQVTSRPQETSILPPWERRSARSINLNSKPTDTKAAQATASITEVTSSYGGLYSSKQTPPTRRRPNLASQSNRPRNGYQTSVPPTVNATDDTKVSGYVSSAAMI